MKISEYEIEKIREVMNIGVGKSASVLNDMISKHIDLSVPDIMLCNKVEFEVKIKEMKDVVMSSIDMPFDGALSGTCKLVFPKEGAEKLIKFFDDELDSLEGELEISILKEVGNVILNALMGTMSNIFKLHLEYEIPEYFEGNSKSIYIDQSLNNLSKILYATTKFSVHELELNGDFVLILELESFDRFILIMNKIYQ